MWYQLFLTMKATILETHSSSSIIFLSYIDVGSGRIIEMNVLEDDVSRSFHNFLVVSWNVTVILNIINNKQKRSLVSQTLLEDHFYDIKLKITSICRLKRYS